jgi:hypothetical protein
MTSEVQIKQLDIDLEKIAADDRANARSMAIATHDLTPRCFWPFLWLFVMVWHNIIFTRMSLSLA